MLVHRSVHPNRQQDQVMANWYILGLLVAVFSVQRGADSLLLTQTAPNLLVEIGVNNAADTQCFFKKIFKGQASPIQITHTMPAVRIMQYKIITFKFLSISAKLAGHAHKLRTG